MRRLALLLCLLCAVASAAPPTIDIPAEIRPAGQYVTLEPKTEAVAITYIGLSGIEPIPSVVLKDPRMFLLDTRGLPAGRYRFVAVGSLKDEHKRVDFQVVIGDVPPGPVPPGPTPPGPNPPVPIPTDGFRVLFLYESSDNMPQEQLNALYSTKVRDYLRQKCAKRQGDGLPEFRFWDKDADLSNESQMWRDIMTATKAKVVKPEDLPMVAVFNGTEGKYMDMPAKEADVLALLKQYGGE